MTVPIHAERPRVAVACGCILGEGPIWDERIRTLYWVDIDGEALWSWRPESPADARTLPLSERIGFVLLTTEPETLVLGLKSGLARLSLVGGTPETVLRPEPDRPGNRLNDACVGPDGSIYFGSLNDTDRRPTGSFYRWSEVGLVRFGESAIVTNGPAIDAVRRVLYVADSANGRVYRHAVGSDGTPGPREDFVTFGPGDGHPDGLAVDVEGHVWICHFGGARVTRFTPEGEPALIVPMPTAQVTKAAFGGPDLSTLFVTTAARGRDRGTDLMAGHLFAVDAGIRGFPAALSRMGLT